MAGLPTPIVPSQPTPTIPFVASAFRRTQDISAAGPYGFERVEGLGAPEIITGKNLKVNIQIFRNSGAYDPSEGMIYGIAECYGAGGGGGWAVNATGTNTQAAAGGGGSGGYSRKLFSYEQVQAGVAVTVAAGGFIVTGAAGGGYAGQTIFGSLCMAQGGGNAYPFDGSGGVGGFGAPGPGAVAAVGDIALPGVSGSMWSTIHVVTSSQDLWLVCGGFGGSLLGGNQFSQSGFIGGNLAGMNGLPNTGAGGGGAAVNSGLAGTTLGGGQGGTGLVIVTEYCMV